MIPPKPGHRANEVSLLRYLRLFRRDILSAQPQRLYRAWMAEFKTPFFRSFLVNEPALVRQVLNERPRDFPKSERVSEGLRLLLGTGIFVSNGEEWARQRRIIDPAFEAARIKSTFPAMLAAAETACDRLKPGDTEIEEWASHATADVIFRTLFSVPIDDETAWGVFDAFQRFQRAQPLLNLGMFLRLPSWVPRLHRPAARKAAQDIRARIGDLVAQRMAKIKDGSAPDDLATRILTSRDPETGDTFSTEEMVDHVAIFFLAGHETSAAALSWALYLLSTHPEEQDNVAEEAMRFAAAPRFETLSKLPFTRDVVRETLRLYPPVPMLVREATETETFRGRPVPKGSPVILSPWHLHRHERIWSDPDLFQPKRWQDESQRQSTREAYMPFSSGPRVCPGAGFAMAEAAILLAVVLNRWRIAPCAPIPVPVAHLTVRSRNGIFLKLTQR